MRSPALQSPTSHSSHNKPAPRRCTQPCPPQNLQGEQLQVSHRELQSESQPSQPSAISMLPGPGTPWEAEKQSRDCPGPCTDTALRSPSSTCRAFLAHSFSLLLLRATDILLSLPHWHTPEASACLCANKCSFYPALCSQCCLQHPVTPASALISAHRHSSLSLHPFLSWLPTTQFLWTLFSTWGTCTRLLTPRECNSCSLLGFPVLSNALSIYMHSSSICLLKGSLLSC